MTKKTAWIYGKNPNPSNWFEAAEVLKTIKTPKIKLPKDEKDKKEGK